MRHKLAEFRGRVIYERILQILRSQDGTLKSFAFYNRQFRDLQYDGRAFTG